MKKDKRPILFLIFLIAITGSLLRQKKVPLQEENRVTRTLDIAFSSVKPDHGRAVFLISPRSRIHPYRLSFMAHPSQNSSVREALWSGGSRSFAPGATFEISDKRYHAVFTVVRLENDGVVLNYKTSTAVTSKLSYNFGTKKIHWY